MPPCLLPPLSHATGPPTATMPPPSWSLADAVLRPTQRWCCWWRGLWIRQRPTDHGRTHCHCLASLITTVQIYLCFESQEWDFLGINIPTYKWVEYSQLEMWASAQRDGRPAKYRWRPLFNAAKFGWRPLQCSAVTLRRRETRWNLQGCPKLANSSQPLVGQSSPYCEDMWRDIAV